MDQDGREVPGTRSYDIVKPACKCLCAGMVSFGVPPLTAEKGHFFTRTNLAPGLPSAAPPTVRPLPRPDVTPPPNADITLLYAQGQKIGALPLNGTRLDAARSKTLLTLHVRDELSLLKSQKVNTAVAVDMFPYLIVCVRPGLHRRWHSPRLQGEPCLLDRLVRQNHQQGFNGGWCRARNTHQHK